MSYVSVPAIYKSVPAKNIVYGPYTAPIDTGYLPQIDPETRITPLESVVLNSSDVAQVVKANLSHAHAVHAVLEDQYQHSLVIGKPYSIRRSLKKVQRMIEHGTILMVCINGRVAAIGGNGPIMDPEDEGRGPPYTDNGKCLAKDKQISNAAVVHPSLQDKDLRLMQLLAPHRICEAAKTPERDCLLTKTNNPAVKKYYGSIWEKVASFRVPEADNPVYSMTAEEEILDTFKISVRKALDDVKKTRPDVYALHAKEIEFAQKRMAEKINAQAITVNPIATEIAVNDNFETNPKLVKQTLTLL